MSSNVCSDRKQIPCWIIRGGSSKAIVFLKKDLPADKEEKNKVLLTAMGSPDPRQIDGLGGGDKLTSKVAIISPSSHKGCDIDYEFAQIGTKDPTVDWDSNCGNIAAAAAIYPVLTRLVSTDTDHTLKDISIYQVNAGRILQATVPIENGYLATHGAYEIGGVPGRGAEIKLDFSDFAGSCLSGSIFPSGSMKDILDISGIGKVCVSIVDYANLHIFVEWHTIFPSESFQPRCTELISSKTTEILDRIRYHVAEKFNLVGDDESSTEFLSRSMNPLIYLVGAPVNYLNTLGNTIKHDQYNFFSLSYSRGAFSQAHPGSGALAAAITSLVPGTIFDELSSVSPTVFELGGGVLIAHPGGLLEIDTKIELVGMVPKVLKAIISRTGRPLMSGQVFV